MTTSTTCAHRVVPLPDGATFGDAWQGDKGQLLYRVVGGAVRDIIDGLSMWGSAIHYAAGSIDNGLVKAPAVHVANRWVPLERVPALISAKQEAFDAATRWARTASS